MAHADNIERLRMQIHGAVQGVGFRPFVYRLAVEMGLSGWTNNGVEGVVVEVEGSLRRLEAFKSRLVAEKPPASFIQSIEAVYLDAIGYDKFEIVASDQS